MMENLRFADLKGKILLQFEKPKLMIPRPDSYIPNISCKSPNFFNI